MRHQDSIFCQLLKVIPRHGFERFVAEHQGDYRVRDLRCWDQFVSLIYAQLTGCDSLRELESGFNTHAERHYHLGCHRVKRSTLADANASRPVALYESLFGWLLGKALPGDYTAKDALLLIDSSTMPLNQKLFDWAEFRSKKSGVKLHLVYDPDADVPTYFTITVAKKHDMKEVADFPITPGADYIFDRAYNAYSWWQELQNNGCRFVCRLKKNANFTFEKWREPQGKSVLADDIIQLHDKAYQERLRRIVYHCPIKDKRLVFVTNDLTSPALEIAELYKKRWQIELFFKWVKQNLRIKKFLGTSENAVKIQIIIALISYLILRILQQNLPLTTSLKSLTDRIKANIFQRKTILHLFKPPDINYNISGLEQMELEVC
ncbi:MAG: IS4 family transposase [bacterium]|nr:IS4 family transposase [bacterium]